MAWLALGALGLLGMLAIARLFAQASVAQVRSALVWGMGLVGAALITALLLSGRLQQAFWPAVLFGPILWRALRSAFVSWRFGRAGQGATSGVETAMLSMTLDHETGQMSGRVRRGRHAGRELAELDLPALMELLREAATEDPESGPLLEAWLDRACPGWREAEAEAQAQPGRGGPMTRAEALEVLGLTEGTTEAEIRETHRRLMRAVHPDQGGSGWLAARLNEARDTLLRRN